MSEPPAKNTDEVAPFVDENTDGAAAFARATRAAQALSDLPEPPVDPEGENSQTSPTPLAIGRVVWLLVVVGGIWWVWAVVDSWSR